MTLHYSSESNYKMNLFLSKELAHKLGMLSACSIPLYFTEKTVKMWKNRPKWPFFVIWPAGSCGGSSKGVSFVLAWAYELPGELGSSSIQATSRPGRGQADGRSVAEARPRGLAVAMSRDAASSS